MKKILSISLAFLILISGFNPVSANEDQDINILFTHDMHDSFDAYNLLVNDEVQSRGGFERLATAIKEEREIDEELILVDAGDFSMGSLYQSIYATDAPALQLMTYLNYDAVTFGNHEFDFRTQGLVDALNSAKKALENPVPIVASNTRIPKEAKFKALEAAFKNYGVIDDYLMIEKKGLNIAIIGLMGPEADSYSPMAEVDFINYIDVAKETVKKVKDKENPDMIIALSHSGTVSDPALSEDDALAKAVPDIDVIVSGHSHSTFQEPRIYGNTYIVSAGDQTRNLGKLSLTQDGDRWKMKTYDLLALNDDYERDMEMRQKISYFKNKVNENYLNAYGLDYDEVIAYAPFSFTPADKLGDELTEEPLGYLIADAYRYAIEQIEDNKGDTIDVTVVPYGVIRDSITEGYISTKDAFKVSSLGIGKDGKSGYPLLSVYLTGKELKIAAEVDASIQPMQDVAQLYMSGLKYSLNTKRLIFNKVTNIHLLQNGKEEKLKDDQLYRVVANLYTAQMLGLIEDQSMGLLSVTPKTKDGEIIDNFEDHIVYDKEGNELKEWVALTNYLQSFEENEEGISEIPQEYAITHGYKKVTSNGSFIERLKNPNAIALSIYGIILAIILVLFFIIRFIVRRIKRKR